MKKAEVGVDSTYLNDVNGLFPFDILYPKVLSASLSTSYKCNKFITDNLIYTKLSHQYDDNRDQPTKELCLFVYLLGCLAILKTGN